MSDYYKSEPMLELYLFETSQQLEQLEQTIMNCEKFNSYSQESINEIFRYMHTVKGSSSMMLFNNIGYLAHAIEDLFYYLREEKPQEVDYSQLSDLVLESIDFIKIELQKIKAGDEADGVASDLIEGLKRYLASIKIEKPVVKRSEKIFQKNNKQNNIYNKNENKLDSQYKYRAKVYFTDDCEMENVRGFTIIHNLAKIAEAVYYLPEDIIDNDETSIWIREHGFEVFIITDYTYDQMYQFFMKTIYLKTLDLVQLENDDAFQQFYQKQVSFVQIEQSAVADSSVQNKQLSKETTITGQSMISVNVEKLDRLMDLVGEMVIAEAMVTQNPEVQNIQINNFQKSARQLHKITNELQDMVMAIRMVPLSTTFLKMQRIMRDMCKKLGKEVVLEVLGEETEVDKNIIENLSDPLMHLIRNAVDHGIEDNEERVQQGKEKTGKVILEARNSGSDVLVIIKDDGKGLKKEKILDKARQNGLLEKPESEMSDQEIYNLILVPGFSTKEEVTEFSGRGVGMDVVAKNLEVVGGAVIVDSIEGQGTTITLKIPLTLAIIDGMNIKVGDSRYTIPIIAIKESFRPKETDLLEDPAGNEMIMVRGQCHPVLRLHKYFNVNTRVSKLTEGILIMVEHDDKTYCIFADELIGQQQVVIKALPNYIKMKRKISGLSGCTLLGDGSISLILDTGGLINQ